LEEALDLSQAFVPGSIEAAVHEDLDPRSQRPEEQDDHQRRRGRRERGTRADRHAQCQRDRREGRRERRGQGDVDQRAVDQPVDLVEAVAHHRHRDRNRYRGQSDDGGDHGRRALAAGDRALDQAGHDRGRNQQRREREPLEL
jgi:hypothetical protein